MGLKLILVLLFCVSDSYYSKTPKKARFKLEITRDDASNTVIYDFGCDEKYCAPFMITNNVQLTTRNILWFLVKVVCHHDMSRIEYGEDRITFRYAYLNSVGKPTSGREQVCLKNGRIRADRKTSQVTIEHVPCYEVKSVQVILTTTGTPPQAKLDLISRKIVITFSKSFTKPTGSAMVYVLTARGDRLPGCVEENYKFRRGKKGHEISNNFHSPDDYDN